jgi:hypothetical protein
VRRGIIVDGEFFAFLSRSGFVQQGVVIAFDWDGLSAPKLGVRHI